MRQSRTDEIFSGPDDRDSSGMAPMDRPCDHVSERMTFSLNIGRPPCGGYIVLNNDGDPEAAFGRYQELEDYVREKMRLVLDIVPPSTTKRVAARFAPQPEIEQAPERRGGWLAAISGGRT